MDRELEWLHTSPSARRTKSKARIAAYEKMAEDAGKMKVEHGTLVIPPGPRLGRDVIWAKDLCKSFDGNMLLDNVSFRLDRGAIMGKLIMSISLTSA